MYSELRQGFDIFPLLLILIDKSIKEVLNAMINTVDFDTIISKITEKYGHLPFKHFRESTITILSRFSYNQNIFSRANSLLIKDKSMLTVKLVDEYSIGVCSDDFLCGKCKKEIETIDMLNPDNKIIVFECGHTFHSNCIQIKTCECCKNVENRIKEFANALKNKKKTEQVY